MNRAAFYDAVRSRVNLTTQNVIGFEKVLDYGEKRGTPTNDLAYILATAFWESAQTMHPVKEAYWLSEDWRRKNLRYFPYYGRGLVQTTWADNYAAVAEAIGLPENTFVNDPDKLLEWLYALPALFVGMEKGLYTGKDLDDYIDERDEEDDEDLREYEAARRIVNGTDRATEIGRLALIFEKGLKAAKYLPVAFQTPTEILFPKQPDDPGPAPEKPAQPVPAPPDIPAPATPKKPASGAPKRSIGGALMSLLFIICAGIGQAWNYLKRK